MTNIQGRNNAKTYSGGYHLDALQHNLNIARQATPRSKVFAVVKANAYGHGIERVYDAFKTADGFALLDIAEAIRVRDLELDRSNFTFRRLFSAEDLVDCEQYRLSFSIHNEQQVEWLEQFQAKIKLNLTFFSK